MVASPREVYQRATVAAAALPPFDASCEYCNVVAATLNAIKGRPMAVDVCSFVQDGKRTFSYMSQCLGLMADLDLGTEHLRILGSNRFVYGYLRGGAFS